MIKTTEIAQIHQFWDWFNTHKYYYEDIENEWDPDLELLSEKLELIHPDINAMIAIDEYRQHQIVFTSEGIIDHFELIRAIVNASPAMIKWQAIAFVQPCPGKYSVGYNKYLIDSSTMFFMPYFDEDYFSIYLYAEHLGEVKEEDADYLGRQILIKTMGEFHFATKVSAYLLQDLNDAIDEEELLPLDKLHTFILNNFMNNN